MASTPAGRAPPPAPAGAPGRRPPLDRMARQRPRARPRARASIAPDAADANRDAEQLLRLPVLPAGLAMPTCTGAVTVHEPAWAEALDAALAASLASGKVGRERERSGVDAWG